MLVSVFENPMGTEDIYECKKFHVAYSYVNKNGDNNREDYLHLHMDDEIIRLCRIDNYTIFIMNQEGKTFKRIDWAHAPQSTLDVKTEAETK